MRRQLLKIQMADPAEPQPEPQPAEGDGTPLECFICLEARFEGNASAALLRGGCACRGAAGHVHVACLVEAAQAKVQTWRTCPTYKQHWMGSLALELARAWWELAGGLQEEDVERLEAALNLTQALREGGQYPEALKLGRGALTTVQRVFGDDHGHMSVAAGVLAAVTTRWATLRPPCR